MAVLSLIDAIHGTPHPVVEEVNEMSGHETTRPRDHETNDSDSAEMNKDDSAVINNDDSAKMNNDVIGLNTNESIGIIEDVPNDQSDDPGNKTASLPQPPPAKRTKKSAP
ncbi:uncharacterized protein LOC111041381 [Myzus persicae]|uniref:uncharacterized protein LOC111041381 n=1 Tax=Myzus persicae TaxID=13164 RepID=UPI000B939075|nr:uncharacterized protein LOC111041381 [Myzus persicae]